MLGENFIFDVETKSKTLFQIRKHSKRQMQSYDKWEEVILAKIQLLKMSFKLFRIISKTKPRLRNLNYPNSLSLPLPIAIIEANSQRVIFCIN